VRDADTKEGERVSGAFQTAREIFDNPIWQNIVEFRLFFLIYGKAAFTDGVRIGDIELKRGQWLRSLRNLQVDLQYIENRSVKQYSLSRIHRAIDNLVKQNRIFVKHTELGTLFTVLNYARYQDLDNYKRDNENAERTQRERRENANGTEMERRWNNNKNAKNAKNEKNISNIDFSNHNFSDIAKSKIEEWLTYKKERRENYKPTGLKSLLTQIETNISTYGEQRVIDLISECMAAGYKGIIWDKLKKTQYKQDKPAKRNNFEQRQYDDDFFDELLRTQR
jgi:hypothetical protein